jgi:DnaK suppressor protein
MTPAQLKKYEKKLEELRAEALAEEPAKIEPNRKDPTTVGVSDEDEQALSEMMQTLASQRNKKQAERVAQIDRALRRLRSQPEEFGLCEECEEEIGDKRLALMPFATLCLECQSTRDPKRGQSRKSLTDFK